MDAVPVDGVSMNSGILTAGNLFSGAANPKMFIFRLTLDGRTVLAPLPKMFILNGTPLKPKVPLSLYPDTAYTNRSNVPPEGINVSTLFISVKGILAEPVPKTFGNVRLNDPLPPTTGLSSPETKRLSPEREGSLFCPGIPDPT